MKKLSNINESTWGDMVKRAEGNSIRKEDELTSEEKRQFICWYVQSFAYKIVFYDKYVNSLDGFKKMLINRKKLNSPSERKDAELVYLSTNWDKDDNIQQQVNDYIQKLEKPFPSDFKKEPGKSIHDTLLDWWNTLDIEKKKDIIYNTFENSKYQNELFNEYGDDVDEYDNSTLDEVWKKELAYYQQAEYYLEYHKTNESTWGDMVRRAEGDEIRKEDEIGNIQSLKPVDIGGSVLWADQNLIYDDEELFTFHEACELIKGLNWRLPTREEVAELDGHNRYYDSKYIYLDDDRKLSFKKCGVGYMFHGIESTLDENKVFYGWTSEKYKYSSNDVHVFVIDHFELAYSPQKETINNQVTQNADSKCCIRLVKDK